MKSQRIPLNYDWQYRILAPIETSTELVCPPEWFSENCFLKADGSLAPTVHLPHANVEVPYNYFDDKLYQVVSHYRKILSKESLAPYINSLEQSDELPLLTLHFGGVMTSASVYVNSMFAGHHKGGYTPFAIRIDPYLTPSDAIQIDVIVDSREIEQIPPFGFVIDYLTYGGIYREVALEVSEKIRIETCHVMTKQVLTPAKILDLDLYLNNESDHPANLLVTATLQDAQGQTLETFDHTLDVLSNTHQHFRIKHPLSSSALIKLWDTEHPNLYQVVIDLYNGPKMMDSKAFRFGFREVAFQADGFYLNGNRVKLRGLNRHQSFPYVGYAMPKSAQIKDADILKYDLGVNTVRLSHYPQSDHFLDRCDELGLLVFDEIPGWQHIGDSEEWRRLTEQNVIDMIKKDWNHPSVFIWGVRINESQDCDSLYRTTNQIARDLDETRPTGGVRYIEGSQLLEDVYTFNDFSHTGGNHGLKTRKQVAGAEVPYLITEFNGHMYPTKKTDSAPQRLEHALRHLRVLDAAYKDNDISGCIGWCLFDYNTHKDFGSGDRICYHGVLDMFRLPKLAAAVYASQQKTSPVMTVASEMEIGDFPGGFIGETIIFTNCDAVKVYKNSVYIDTFYPNKKAYPHVPCPPVIIDNYLGNQLADGEGFSTSDSERLKKIFTKISKVGPDAIAATDKAHVGYLLMKYKLTTSDLYQLYAKYMNNWGTEATTYRYEGYIGDQLVKTEIKTQIGTLALKAIPDATALVEEDTYDVTRIVLTISDEHQKTMLYGDEIVTLTATGPIEIIGPTVIQLIGGSRALWVKSTLNGIAQADSPQLATLTASSNRFGSVTLPFEVHARL